MRQILSAPIAPFRDAEMFPDEGLTASAWQRSNIVRSFERSARHLETRRQKKKYRGTIDLAPAEADDNEPSGRVFGMAAFEAGFYRSVLEASPSPVIVFECRAENHFIRYVNPAFERRTGYSATAIADCDWQLLYRRESDAEDLQLLRAAISAGGEAHAVLRAQCSDGTEFWSELHVAPLTCRDGVSTQYVGILRDITIEKTAREQLEHRALHDALTGLPNRYLFQDRLEHAIDHARSRECTFAVVAIDLDDFKHVNDTLGHQAGDELLRQVATRLSRALRAGDTVARVGGDEFILLLESVHERGPLAMLLERVLELVEQPALIVGERIEVRCSLGVSRYPFDGTDGASLLREADRAMYKQKAHHRRPPLHIDPPLPDPGATALVANAQALSH